MNPSRWKYAIPLMCALLGISMQAEAKRGTLLVVVQDVQGQPVKGVKIGIEGAGDCQETGGDGKALLTLAKQTKENEWVTFEIVQSPPGEDLVIVAPAGHRHTVPSFEDKAENYVLVWVITRSAFIALITRPRTREVVRRISSAPSKQQ